MNSPPAMFMRARSAATAGQGSIAPGGCAANAYHSTGSVRGIYEYGCDLFRKRMECALMVAAAREIKAAESDEANAPA